MSLHRLQWSQSFILLRKYIHKISSRPAWTTHSIWLRCWLRAKNKYHQPKILLQMSSWKQEKNHTMPPPANMIFPEKAIYSCPLSLSIFVEPLSAGRAVGTRKAARPPRAHTYLIDWNKMLASGFTFRFFFLERQAVSEPFKCRRKNLKFKHMLQTLNLSVASPNFILSCLHCFSLA